MRIFSSSFLFSNFFIVNSIIYKKWYAIFTYSCAVYFLLKVVSLEIKIKESSNYKCTYYYTIYEGEAGVAYVRINTYNRLEFLIIE